VGVGFAEWGVKKTGQFILASMPIAGKVFDDKKYKEFK
jgi:hypothetical protein